MALAGRGAVLTFDPTGDYLLNKLAEIWTQFYTSILPTLQAIFVPVQVCTQY